MDIDRINQAIAVMERAKLHDSIRMDNWQTPLRKHIRLTVTETDLHTCGNKACFAGYLAVSPEWQNTPGFTINPTTGGPIYVGGELFQATSQGKAISEFLKVQEKVAYLFVYNPYDELDSIHPGYKVAWIDVRAEHVIRELTLLRDLGEDAYMATIKDLN